MASIRRHNAYAKDAYTYYPVVIVGAGESGIAMGCQLKKALGFDQFRIFDRQSGIGGTWWINRYPGVACDIPATFYSFSFAQNPNWSALHPPGPEIARYLADVCAKYEIVDKIQLHTEVTELKWLEDEEEWEISLAHLRPGTGDWSELERRAKVAAEGSTSVYIATEIVRAKIAISAVGGLIEPNVFPKDIPGIDTFEGDIVHTAKWRDDVDFTGKDVIVLGTGASGAQVVPALVKEPYNAKSVTQLMRTPPWVRPFRDDRESTRLWGKYAPVFLRNIPGMMQALRIGIFLMLEHEFFLIFANTDYTRKHLSGEEEECLRYMKKVAPSKYLDMLTPNYRLGCKRRVIGGEWYRSLHDPKIELTTRRLKSIQARSVTLGSHLYPRTSQDQNATEKIEEEKEKEDVELAADSIILANGYRTNEWLHPLRVVGKNGQSLHDIWDERGGPQAYLGIAMDKFPNFFMIFGPNTATGHSSVILATENAVQYSLKFIRPILEGNVSTWEVKEDAEREWTSKIQNELKHTTFFSGCSSWYTREDGWNSTTYPFSQIDYGLRCMFPVWNHWQVKFTPDGRRRRQRRALIRGASLMAIVVFYIWSKKRPAVLQALKMAFIQVITEGFGSVTGVLRRLAAI